MRGERGKKNICVSAVEICAILWQFIFRSDKLMLQRLVRPDRFGVLTGFALLLAAAALPVVAEVPGHISIRIINAQTGQPVTNERLNVGMRADQIGSVAMATDKKGLIDVDTGGATTIRILSNMYADCRPRAELYTDYSIATIHSSGITTGNLCSSAQPKAKPGELILFEIPKTYVPTMPNPPVDSLPHSPR